MKAPVNTTTFKDLQVLKRIEYLSALPSPQGILKCYYLQAHSLQRCLNDHQAVAWVTITFRLLPAQLLDAVSLPPPACIRVSSLVLTAQRRDHLSGLSARFSAKASLPCNKGSYAFQKKPIFINTYNEYNILLTSSECDFERLTRLLLHTHLEGGAKRK